MAAGRISRPRVDAALRASVSSARLTLVAAPLGVGKTSAIQSALRDVDRLAWLDGKPWHAGAFGEPLVAAVRAVRPEFGRVTRGAIAAGANAEHLAGTFAQELTHVDEPLVLVIDDAQVFASDPDFARFMGRLLSACPPAVHLLLSGRVLPELALGELFVRRQAGSIPSALFEFDEDEIRALAEALGHPIDAERARELAASTKGWAAGIVLALSDPAAFAAGGTRSAAATYLSEQLLPSLPADLVTFLEATSVFETLDMRVLESSDSLSGPRSRIAGLRRGGALVTELPGDRFRVHPLLRELAAARLSARGGTAGAHAVAAQAYAATGELRAALFHVAAAGDPRAAARFFRAHADAAVATGDGARVREVAANIDPAGSDRDVRRYVEALLGKAHGSSAARVNFVRAAEAADDAGNAALAFNARAQILEHDLARLHSGSEATISDLLERAPPLGLAAVARATMLRGWELAVAHDFGAAAATIEPLLHRGDAVAQYNSAILLAYVQTALGAGDAAEATLDGLIRLLENDDRVVLQTQALIWNARLSLIWGKTNAAADAAFGAERLARALDLHADEAALYAALTEVAAHLGDIESTVRYAEAARRRADSAWYAADVDRVRAIAQLALARAAFLGRENAIARDLTLRAALAPNVPSAQLAVFLAEGAVYALLADPATAAQTIEAARGAIVAARAVDAADAAAIGTAADVIAFLDAANGRPAAGRLEGCTAFAALIDQRRGLVTLELAGVAVSNARRGTGSPAAFDAAIGALTREGPRFEARLARAYASRFMKPERAPSRPVPESLDLTPREIEILTLLVDGLTNKEIAQRLVVSPRTVETHVERVLGKLDVRSRSRAIAKAIRLRIVELDAVSL